MKYFLATAISILMLSTSWNLYAGAKGGGKKPPAGNHQKLPTAKQLKKQHKKESKAEANFKQKYNKYLGKYAESSKTGNIADKNKYKKKIANLKKNSGLNDAALRQMKDNLRPANNQQRTNTATNTATNTTPSFPPTTAGVRPPQANNVPRNTTSSQSASTSTSQASPARGGLGALGAQVAARAPSGSHPRPNRVNGTTPKGGGNIYSSAALVPRKAPAKSYDNANSPL